MRRVASFVAVLALSACFGKNPYDPGTRLGTFHVTAKLVSSSCGAAPDPWEFDVKLNHEASALYWVQGGLPIRGTVDAASMAKLESSSVHELRPAETRRALCSVARTDVLEVALRGADAQPAREIADTASFAGALSYGFVPTDGSSCSDQLSAVGGGFEALPCEVRYEVAGARTEALPKGTTTN